MEFALLALFAFIAWIFWPFLIGTGWLPSPMKAVRRMLGMAEVGPGDTLYDLGSGDGRFLIAAARELGARAVGIEADPLRVALSRLRIRAAGLQGMASVRWGNFFRVDLGEASVVTIYQSQGTNNDLRAKLERELRPGARVVSYMFTFDGWEPAEADEDSNVYLYVIGRSRGRGGAPGTIQPSLK